MYVYVHVRVYMCTFMVCECMNIRGYSWESILSFHYGFRGSNSDRQAYVPLPTISSSIFLYFLRHTPYICTIICCSQSFTCPGPSPSHPDPFLSLGTHFCFPFTQHLPPSPFPRHLSSLLPLSRPRTISVKNNSDHLPDRYKNGNERNTDKSKYGAREQVFHRKLFYYQNSMLPYV